VRPFLDEGEPIRSLLAAVCHVTDATDPLTAAFYQQISAEIGTQGAATLPDSADDNEFEKGGAVFEPLNAREIEILRLVRTGRANRDIGIELGLSQNTVKWHLSRAYEKLGARSRMQAVNRAQRLGLL
jgi:LuxR family maltose regulon positive regulatory protein